MSKDNFVIADTNIHTITQQLLIYLCGYYRNVVCVDKKEGIRLIRISERVHTAYGKDVGDYAFESANEEQRREWLKLLRKNPQIDLNAKLVQ